MKVNRTSLRAIGFFVASCVVAVLAVQGVYDWERGRGTHTGSWAVGTEAGLRSGLFPLLVIVGLSIASVLSARRRARVLAAVAALMLVAATVYGVRTAGGRAAVDRYNDFPTVPPCAQSWNFEPDEPGFTTPSNPTARRIDKLFADLEHPGRFWQYAEVSLTGCQATFATPVTLAQGAALYRRQLQATGWAITDDDPALLRALRGNFVFTFRTDEVTIELSPAGCRRTLLCTE